MKASPQSTRYSNAVKQIAIKAPPHVDFCFGYPGVPFTKPRLVGTVEIRSNGLQPIPVSYVSISLNQYEKILAPSKSGAPLAITSTKYTYHTVIGNELMLFQAPNGCTAQPVTSIDLPFVIEIPIQYEELPAASLILPGGTCETTYQLVATLHQAQSAATRVTALVKIERFDNLSSWDIFQIPRLVEIVGADHIAYMSVVLPVTCIGPLDPITILVNIAPNPDWPTKARKIRVHKIQVSIEEIVTLKPPAGDEIITKKKKILRTELDCSGVKLDRTGIAREVRTKMPCKAIQDFRAGIIDSASYANPLQMGFTTSSALYGIDYQLAVRAVLSGAKDLVSAQPLHVCSWTSETSTQIMKTIYKSSTSSNRRESYPQDNFGSSGRGTRTLLE